MTEIKKLDKRKISPGTLLAVCTVLLFLPFTWSMALGFIILIAAAFTGALWKAVRMQPGAVWIYSFGILQIFSSLQADNALGVLNALGILAVGMLAALFGRFMQPDNLHKVLKTTVLFSAGMALMGIAEFLHLASAHAFSLLDCLLAVPEVCRIRTVYYNPNLYAAMIVFFLILCLYLFLEKSGFRRRLFYGSIGLLNLAALYLTGSRGAVLSLVVIVPLFLLCSRHKKLARMTLAAEGVFGGAILLHPGLIPRLTKMTSIKARLDIWEAGIHYLSRHPWVGGGPQYYQLLSSRFPVRKAAHCHNLLLDVLLNSGVIGFLMISMYLHKALKACMLPQIAKELPLYRPLIFSLAAAAAIGGLADCTINFPSTALLLLSVLSMPAYFAKEPVQDAVLQPSGYIWSAWMKKAAAALLPGTIALYAARTQSPAFFAALPYGRQHSLPVFPPAAAAIVPPDAPSYSSDNTAGLSSNAAGISTHAAESPG